MYSERVIDRNKNNNGSSAVPLVFHHALSSIVFSTEKEDESVNYEITAVNLHGYFIQEADFNQNIDENVDKTTGAAKWENPAEAKEANFAPSISSTGKVDVTTVPTQFTQKESALLLLFATKTGIYPLTVLPIKSSGKQRLCFLYCLT